MPQNNYHITTENREHNGNAYYRPHSSSLYEIKSEEVQDIMSKMPSRIIRQGTTVLFIMIILLFVGSYFIHYPDVIVTNLNLTSSEPPVKLVSQVNGRIQQIFVQSNQIVKKNESICLLENPAKYSDMLKLKNTINYLDTTLDLSEALKTVSFNQYMVLGELQADYAYLYQSIQQYLFFVDKNFITQKVKQLKSQMGYQSELNKELQNRDVLLNQQLMLERKKFEADSLLLKEKVIAPLEFDNSKKELINKQMNAESTKSGILQNRLQETEYLKTITDLQQQKLQQENDLQQKIRENVKRLQGEWEIWEHKYLIKSPVEGKAVFFNVWKANQYVVAGDAILMITPPVQNYVAKASLPVDGAGKVKPGQKVLIRLSSYPFDEFGMIAGKVESVSAVALDTAYSIDIKLINGLTTTTRKKIPSNPQLSGVAEVLTDDKSILERVFEKIWLGNKL